MEISGFCLTGGDVVGKWGKEAETKRQKARGKPPKMDKNAFSHPNFLF